MPWILFLTLLIFSITWAKADPAPILTLLYDTDDLTFLPSKTRETGLDASPALSQDQARSLAADLTASLPSAQPEDPIYRAQQLANVGILQTYAGDLTAGDQSLRAALAHFNQSLGLFDPRLTRLLSAIGINGFLREDYDTAEDHFRWSQNVQHRSHGLFAAEQTSNLNWLTRTYLITGQTAAADTAQRYVLGIAEQVLPAGSHALSEVKIGIAAYLGQRAKTISPLAEDLERLLRQTLYTDSLALLDQAILEITAVEGPYSVKLIDALETKAQVYGWRDRNNRLQVKALAQILTIVENQADVTPDQLSDAWLALADGYILTGNEKALSAYRSAWLVANPAPAAEAVTVPIAEPPASLGPELENKVGPAASATDPVLLWPDAYQPMYFSPVIDPDDAEPETGYGVDLQFTISTEGRPRRVTVLRKNVPNREVRWTRTMILNSRYRPALRNGIAEEVSFSLRQIFLPVPATNAAPPEDRASIAVDAAPDAAVNNPTQTPPNDSP